MSIAGAIIGGSIISGLLAKKSADAAADASRAGSQASIDEQRRQFDLIRGDTQPYRDVGSAGVYRLADIFGLTPPGGYPAPNYGSSASGGGGAVSPPTNRATWASSIDPTIIGNLNIDPNQPRALGPIVRPSADYRTPESGGQTGTFIPNETRYFASGAGGANGTTGENQYFAGGPGSFNERTGQNPLARGDYIPLQQGADGTYSSSSSHRNIVPESLRIAGVPYLDPNTNPADVVKSLPGYQFRLGEGTKAIERYASKYRGSPRAQKELGRYVSDYSSSEFNKYLDRATSERNTALESYFRLAGIGGNAVNTSANAGVATGQGVSNAIQSGANSAANAAIAGGAGVNNAIQGGISNYLTLQQYNKQPTPFYGVGAYPY